MADADAYLGGCAPTTMTSMPKSISSRRRLSDMPSMACLEAAYAPMNGAANLPPTDDTMTMRPGGPRKLLSAPSSGRNAYKYTSSLCYSFGSRGQGPLGLRDTDMKWQDSLPIPSHLSGIHHHSKANHPRD